MDYIEPAQARNLSGLRLVLTKGVPGPWSESAKGVFRVKNIPFTPVAQHGGGTNEDLLAWTGIRNAPIAVWNDEAPRQSWIDILMLAERLAPEIPLLPADFELRTRTLGLAHLLCGEMGFGWCRRVAMLPGPQATAETAGEAGIIMRDAYGYWGQTKPESAERCAKILSHLATTLHTQKMRGRRYFVGDGLTCVDVYWACFSQLVAPLPQEVNPMSEFIRTLYSTVPEPILAAADPILMTHRDFMFETHLDCPLDF